MSTAVINDELFAQLESELQRISVFQRTPAVRKGMRAAVNIVANTTRQKLPRPPHVGKKADKPHLQDTVGVTVYQNDATGQLVGRVKWDRKKGGYHGHLVEAGHRIVTGGSLKKPKTSKAQSRPRAGKGVDTGKRVEGKRYLAQSWDETQQAQMMELESGIKKALSGKK